MISEEYKKMVLALPDDFFEMIEPEFGNLYWVETYQGWIEGYSRKTYAVCSIILDTGRYYLSLQDRQDMDEVVGNWEFEYNKRDKAIHWRKWLIPSQEQLQKMIINDFKVNGLIIEENRYNIYLEWRFEAWLRDQIFEEKAGLSFECLWMGFLEYVIYGKKWDGEKWI